MELVIGGVALAGYLLHLLAEAIRARDEERQENRQGVEREPSHGRMLRRLGVTAAGIMVAAHTGEICVHLFWR